MAQKLAIEPVAAGPALEAWALEGTSRRLVLCFSGIGRDPGTSPGYEFATTASSDGRDHVLFIADPGRTWLNGPGLIEDIVELASDHYARIGAEEIVTLGHSMGGFAAIAVSAWLPVHVAIGFSPQYSVHPEVAGDDPRWMEYRAAISDFALRDLGDSFNEKTSYFVFHGEHPREAVQREKFPRRPNLNHYYFRKVVHEVPQVLKAGGVLHEVVQEAFADHPRRVRVAMEDAGVGVYRRPRPGELPREAFARANAEIEARHGRAQA